MEFEYFKNTEYLNIAKENKVSKLVAKTIEAYNIKLDKHLKIDNPYKYNGMKELVGYLLKAVNAKKRIVVYGDYDVDGICSVGILKRMFDLLNTPIGYYIPNRYKDGYGLTNEKVNEISNKGYDILICIDNGINANESINLAKEKNLDVIILDHHELNSNIPNCNYYLHPQLSGFSDYNMCASSIAYYLSLAMLSENDPKCAILAGIATLSDVMPLINQNKLLVRQSIDLLNKHLFTNLDLLIDENEYNETILTMSLIPKLNSVGRILKDTRVNYLIKFLFETDKNKTLEYVKFILECNKNRKTISDECFNNIEINKSNKIIVYKDDSLIEGVCGIVASKLVNSFNIPAIVFAKSEDGKYYKGSARSIDGINIVDALSTIDYIVNFGGHQKAAGITINIDDFDKFELDIARLINSCKPILKPKIAVLLEENELTYKSYLEVLKYGPFGEENPYPVYGLKNIDKSNINLSKDKKHLIIKLNEEVTLLGFNLAKEYQEKYNNYEAIFTLDKNNLIKNKLSCKCISINGGV